MNKIVIFLKNIFQISLFEHILFILLHFVSCVYTVHKLCKKKVSLSILHHGGI